MKLPTVNGLGVLGLIVAGRGGPVFGAKADDGRIWAVKAFEVDAAILGEIGFCIPFLQRDMHRKFLETGFANVASVLVSLHRDASTAFRWADLLSELRRNCHGFPLNDSIIAATALVHGLTVVTRNLEDFQRSGVS